MSERHIENARIILPIEIWLSKLYNLIREIFLRINLA